MRKQGREGDRPVERPFRSFFPAARPSAYGRDLDDERRHSSRCDPEVLNHVETGVTAVYDRYSYDNEKRVALDAWGRQVAVILANEQATPKVLAFSGG